MTRPVAIMNWMRVEPVEGSIARAARYGYDAVELSGDPARIDAGRVRAALEEHRLECWGAATIMTNSRDLTHEDAYIRRATLDYVKDTITFAAELGGKIVTITPAVGKLAPVADFAQEWRWMVEALREAQDLAGQLGIRIGIESLNRFETYLCNRGELAVELATEVGDGFGVILDLFHINIEEPDLRAALETAGPLLVDFHVADNNRRPPGQGALDWSAVLQALDAIDYRGCLTVEFFYRADLSDQQYDDDVRASIDFLRDQFEADRANMFPESTDASVDAGNAAEGLPRVP